MSRAVSVRNLTKSYRRGRVRALQGLDFDVREGGWMW